MPRSQTSIVSVVSSSLKRKEDHSVLEMLREQVCSVISLAKISFELSLQNYCVIVHILVWSKNFKKAMRILLQLLDLNEKGGVLEGFDVYESLFSCTDDCNWNPVAFDMLVKAYLRKGRVKESFGVFKKMLNAGFVPNVITVNCLLNMLSRTGYVEKCWDVFERTVKVGIVPNTCTFNILTHVLCKQGDVDKVNEFLKRFEEEQGFDPDIVTYNMLIDSFCKKNKLKDAVHLYNIMYRRGVDPDLITYTTLINGLCKCGNMREAHKLFHLMVHGGFDRMASASNLIVELRRFGVTISRDTYCFLILTLCKDDRPYAAKTLLVKWYSATRKNDQEHIIRKTLNNCNFTEYIKNSCRKIQYNIVQLETRRAIMRSARDMASLRTADF